MSAFFSTLITNAPNEDGDIGVEIQLTFQQRSKAEGEQISLQHSNDLGKNRTTLPLAMGDHAKRNAWESSAMGYINSNHQINLI